MTGEPRRPRLNTAYRYVEAVVPALSALQALRAYPRFIRERRRYADLLDGERLSAHDDYPCLLDRTSTTPYDPHYTFQDGWAAREVASHGPESHVDVGSRISFVMGLSAFVQVTFVDLRPLEIELPGLTSIAGDVLELPFEDRSLPSVSCLHVAEHVGLGRYGDPLDPNGTVKAAKELERVLATEGRLLFSLPVGRPRTAFNAHRIHDPRAIAPMFSELRLAGFAGVDDSGVFHSDIAPEDLVGSEWACGFYALTRD